MSGASETTRAGRWVGDPGWTGRLKIEIETRVASEHASVGWETGAHPLVRVVHPRDAEERGGEEGGESHETEELEQPSDPERRERERTGGVNLDGWNVGERHARNDGWRSRVRART